MSGDPLSIVSAARQGVRGDKQVTGPVTPNYQPTIAPTTDINNVRKRLAEMKLKPKNEKTKKTVLDLDLATTSIDDLPEKLEFLHTFPKLSTHTLTALWGEKLISIIPAGFEISHKLGSGSYGTVYLAGNSSGGGSVDYIAIKVAHLKNKKELTDEVDAQNAFAAVGIAPEVLSDPVFYKHNDKLVGVLAIGLIHGVLNQLLQRPLQTKYLYMVFAQILDIISTMRTHELTHGDLHDQNISFTYIVDSNGELGVSLQCIDFGMSTVGQSNSFLDLIQILRTISGTYKPLIDTRNKSVLVELLYAFIDSNYNIDDINDQDGIETLFSREHSAYMSFRKKK